jgi:uncharacterized protein YegP (UPF0339 family)
VQWLESFEVYKDRADKFRAALKYHLIPLRSTQRNASLQAADEQKVTRKNGGPW